VNNAGAVIATHASRTSDADASSQMETNFLGPVRVVRHACAAMKESLSKRILIVGSIGGRVGLPFQSMYSASKAAVMVYADALRTETKSDGFRVTLVEPGDMRPGMVNAAKAAGFDDDPIAKRATDIMRAEEAKGTEMRVAAMAIVRAVRSNAPPGRVLVGQDAWEVEMLTRLVPHWAREYLLASHYRVPPRDNAWIRI
jgi:NAD(P)-dependent dehydrogenase (short-subunit alcohol dehydrogenase family)